MLYIKAVFNRESAQEWAMFLRYLDKESEAAEQTLLDLRETAKEDNTIVRTAQ